MVVPDEVARGVRAWKGRQSLSGVELEGGDVARAEGPKVDQRRTRRA